MLENSLAKTSGLCAKNIVFGGSETASVSGVFAGTYSGPCRRVFGGQCSELRSVGSERPVLDESGVIWRQQPNETGSGAMHFGQRISVLCRLMLVLDSSVYGTAEHIVGHAGDSRNCPWQFCRRLSALAASRKNQERSNYCFSLCRFRVAGRRAD